MIKSHISYWLLGASVFALAAPAAAQSGSATGSSGESIETVVVTGSRVGTHEGFTAPTPLTQVSAADLEAKASVTVTDIIADIPALAPNQTVNGSSNVGQTNFNLRNIGANRTLVLIDGIRTEATSSTGGFNVNVLPALLINKIDIVTGGAAAAYGSDAITGVVNVSFLSQLTGGKLDIQQDTSNYGDDRQTSINFAYGHGFAGEKGQVLFGASWYNEPGIIYEDKRPWGSLGYEIFSNTKANIAAGQPAMVIGPNGTDAEETFGGVIISGPVGVKNIQFGAGAAQTAFNPGQYCGGTVYCQNGDGVATQLSPPGAALPQGTNGTYPPNGFILPASHRINLYLRSSYNITPDIQAAVSILYSYDDEVGTNIPNYDNGDTIISVQNAYLPANLAAIMTANKVTSVLFGKDFVEDGDTVNNTRSDYLRYVGILQGAIPWWKSWSWDTHVEYTQAFYTDVSSNNRNAAKWNMSVDSVANPAVGGVAGVAAGVPVCRDTLSNPNDGCVPSDVFGLNSLSRSAIAYTDGTSYVASWSLELDAAVNVRGDLFDTWAGPVSVATGGEYRRDSVNLQSDPVSHINGWRQASSSPYYGANEVREGYFEAAIPLAPPNLPFVEHLDTDFAARLADYDSSGTAFVWKAGANWTVDDNVRFRATYSRDFRAPSIAELYGATVAVNGGTVIDRQPGAFFGQQENTQTLTGGNPNLKPEESITFTAGIVLTPTFLPGLTVSVDSYNIRMAEALTTFSTQNVVDDCYGYLQPVQPQFCTGINRSSLTGQIAQVNATEFNAQVLKTNGIDFEGAYVIPLDFFPDSWEVSGTLTVANLTNYAEHLETTTNGVISENAGFLMGGNAVPHWRSTTNFTYADGPLTALVRMYYVGPAFYSNTMDNLSEINIPHWDGVTYFDVSAQYALTDRLQVYAKVNNALNRNPPFDAAGGANKGLANASNYYDSIGRLFGLGVRYNW